MVNCMECIHIDVCIKATTSHIDHCNDYSFSGNTVEVVRCRDCAKDGLFTCPICFIENKTLHFINHSPDFYCGEGERKDGYGNG